MAIEQLENKGQASENAPRAENGQFLPGHVYPVKKNKRISDAYASILDQHGADALAERVYCDALTAKNPSDRLAAIQEITDRVEGKAVQSLRIQQALDGQTARVLADLAAKLISVPDRPVLGTGDPSGPDE